jgi:ferredoxin
MKKSRVVLTFPPSKVEEPIIYQLITEYGLKVNILRATIDPGKQGRMGVELSGDNSHLSHGLNFLEGSGVGVESLAQEIRHLEERCTSCTACIPICPTEALDVNRESWVVSYDAEKCVACLHCVDVCPYKAMEICLE